MKLGPADASDVFHAMDLATVLRRPIAAVMVSYVSGLFDALGNTHACAMV